MAHKSSQLNYLLNIMQQLRDPETGCPWDRSQTFESVIPHTIEEAYEVADAILKGDMAEIKDELGDLLFQVVFYAQLSKEQGSFDFEDIAQTMNEKLIRRHPHVFAKPAEHADEGELNHQWEMIKAQERALKGKDKDDSILANVSVGMTPLLRAQKLQKKCSKVGFDWTEIPPVVDKIREEIDEVLEEINAPFPEQKAVEEEIGDLLFAVVNLARHSKVDAETALIKANNKFEQRFRQVEEHMRRSGTTVDLANMDEMEAAWSLVKRQNS